MGGHGLPAFTGLASDHETSHTSHDLSAPERFHYLYTEEGLKAWVAPMSRLAEKAG